MYGVTEYYWWLFHLPNGGFDWDGYWNYVPDGPAFDGVEWLILHGDWELGTLNSAFMWWIGGQCYFAIGAPTNTDPAGSGTCTIEGHRTMEYYDDGEGLEHNVSEIIWYFNNDPAHARTFSYQLGEWGPIRL